MHHSLKESRHIAQPKWHDVKLIQPSLKILELIVLANNHQQDSLWRNIWNSLADLGSHQFAEEETSHVL